MHIIIFNAIQLAKQSPNIQYAKKEEILQQYIIVMVNILRLLSKEKR